MIASGHDKRGHAQPQHVLGFGPGGGVPVKERASHRSHEKPVAAHVLPHERLGERRVTFDDGRPRTASWILAEALSIGGHE